MRHKITVIIITLVLFFMPFQINAMESTDTDIVEVTELDLGDYEKKMVIGTTQLLNVTALPLNASETTVTYSSANKDVATVNGMGRITAIAVGKTQITVVCGKIRESFELEVVAEESTEIIEVTELDLGDYEKKMVIGTTQLLSVTALPLNASETTVTYSSANKDVATVNGMGRITAVSLGKTQITVVCGKISASFELEVTEEASTEVVEVTELDLGDYEKKMVIGTSQLLSVTALPLTVSEATFSYSSANEKIATVNAMGRITAVSLGKTQITVACGKITKSFKVEVVEEENNTIPVKDIEIGSHEAEVEVGKTINISGTVLPSDATNSTITYTSSDTSIATINSTGEVKGIGVGDVIITLSAGDISKTTSLKVKVATSSILLNQDYLILKSKDTYQLSAKVLPTDAVQNVSYRSTNTSVATVSATGLVTAKETGTATIIVSNGDVLVAASVIVNKSTVDTQEEDIAEKGIETKIIYENIILASENKVVNSEMLKQIYETKQVLQIVGDGYVINIDGNDIVNYNNVFYTDISLTEDDNTLDFILNDGKELCGKVTLFLENPKGKYLYLYNTSKQTYQQIENIDLTKIELTTGGEYQIREKRLRLDMQIVLYFMIGGVFTLLVSFGIYIFTKRRYWFW